MFGISPENAAFYGAAAAIGVPLIANFFKELWFDRRKRRAERAFISVQLVFLLDKFIANCANVSWDCGYDPMNPPPDETELEDQVQIPNFDMTSVKGEYKYLKPSLLYKLHNIDIELYKARSKLYQYQEECYFSPDLLWEYYELRRESYANVGLYVASIADELRKEFGISKTEDWDPRNSIVESMKQLRRIRANRAMGRMERKSARIMKKVKEQQGQAV
ncbi:hypothetical protein [Enterobacter soli]|jgi:hypothetical protein|uniref:hypothetical protein n=1 Tax=Enterobacter soli TaxID=885040 RepID=UPI003F85E1D9